MKKISAYYLENNIEGQALRVPGKNFFLSIEFFNGKKLFAGNLDTSRPTLEMAIAPRLLICCLSQSLSHTLK